MPVKTSTIPSAACFFQLVIRFGWTPCRLANSATVRSPRNASRIVIRFWKLLPVNELAANILRYFDDLEIVHSPQAPDYPAFQNLLRSTAVQGKPDNIPHSMAGDLIEDIGNDLYFFRIFFCFAYS